MSCITKLKKVEDFEKLKSHKGLDNLCCEKCSTKLIFFLNCKKQFKSFIK